MKHLTLHLKIARIVLIALVIFSSLPAFTTVPVSAADFSIHIERDYRVTDSGESMHISELRTVTANSATFYIPTTSSETFSIQNFKGELTADELEEKQNTLSIREYGGSSLYFSVEIEGDTLLVKAPYPRPLYAGQQFTFQMEYDTSELVEKVGSLTNYYVPGINSDYEEINVNDSTGISTGITYDISLTTPGGLDDSTFTLPDPVKTTTEGTSTTYRFDTADIIGSFIWHQVGTHQTYHFTLYQELPATDTSTPETLDFFSKNEYRITLPRDYGENNQNTYYINISPEPDHVELDGDGNLIASFILDATQDQYITAEGYISMDNNVAETADPPDSTLADIPYESMQKYLQSAEYWESDDPDIIAKAEELMDGETSVYQILRNDYLFIIDSIDYDEFKYGERNQRRGALATLHGESSVCMEYSDLLIALARAQGIPARAAYGYGYDPNYPSNEQEEHQWVQAWVPDYGWLTLDPTWGETGREFIGKDLDHALWYVASANPNEPSPLEVFSGAAEIVFEPSIIEINAVEEIPAEAVLKTAAELTEIFPETDNPISNVATSIQTTAVGRLVVTFLPVCGTLMLAALFVYGIIRVSGAFRKGRKAPPRDIPDPNDPTDRVPTRRPHPTPPVS